MRLPVLCACLAALFWANPALVQAEDGCQMIAYNPKEVQDNTSFVIKVTTANVKGIEVIKNDYSVYVEVKKTEGEDNSYDLVSTDEFQKFEEQQSVTTLVIRLNLQCEDGTPVDEKNLLINVKDTNNHAPFFTKDTYTFKLPMPFSKGLDISTYGSDAVIASDLDISNKNIVFTISPSDDFEVSTQELGSKQFGARITSKKSLQFDKSKEYEITAMDTGDPTASSTPAKLVIEVDEAAYTPAPKFNGAYHLFEYHEDGNLSPGGQLTVTDSSYVQILLDDQYGAYFEANMDDTGNVVITPKNKLPEDVLSKKTFLPITLSAKYEDDIVAETALIIQLPVENIDTTTACPTVPSTTEQICECPSTTVASTCEPCPSSSTLEPTTCEPCTTEATVTTTCPTPEPCPTISTTEPPECPVTTPCDCQTASTDTTTCPTCQCESTTIADCPTSTATTCPPCVSESTTIADCTTISAITCPPCPTETTTTTDCSTSSAATCPPCQCDSTTVSDCPTSAATTCPPCEATTTSSTDPTPPPGHLSFEKDEYEFTKAPDFTGVLDTIRAKAEPDELILYGFSGRVPSQVTYDLDTGELIITSYLPTGIYQFNIEALGDKTNAEAKTTVRIIITSTVICNDLPRLFTVYVQKRADEEQEEPSILVVYDKKDEAGEILKDYDLEIVGVFPQPNEGTGPFSIDADGNLVMAKVDREANIFSRMQLPQYRVTIELVKKTTNPRRSSTEFFTTPAKSALITIDADENDQCIIMPENIRNTQQTVVTVVINDQNDNDPVFEVDKVTVGYPEEKLAAKVAPPYLTVVQATDKDAGVNAQVQYSIDTDKFVIHPTSGVIYPTEQSFGQNSNFKVTATDMNGQGRKSKELQVEVQLLNSKQISVLLLKNVLLEDLEAYLHQITVSTGIKIKSLASSVIGAKTKSNLRATSEDYYLRVIAYAINDQNDIMTTEDTKDKLDEVEDLDVDDIETYFPENPEEHHDDDKEPDDVTRYIIAISILGVLLAAFIIIFIIIYFVKLRKPNDLVYTTGPLATEGVDTEKNADSLSKRPVRRATGYPLYHPPIEEDEDEGKEDVDEPQNGLSYVSQKNPVIMNNNNNENDLYTVVVDGNDQNAEDDSDEERLGKKSVKFFNMVEKITIEDHEAEKDDDANSSHNEAVEHQDAFKDDFKDDNTNSNHEDHPNVDGQENETTSL